MKRGQTVVVGVVLAAVALALGACGWTPRDEFLQSRSVMIAGKPGDGSELATDWKQQQSQHARANGRAPATAPASRFNDD